MKIEQQIERKYETKRTEKLKIVSLIPKETQTSKQKSKRAKRKLGKI